VIGRARSILAALLGVSAVVAGSVAIHRHGLLLNGWSALPSSARCCALLGRSWRGPATC
jgi:hypothetical protein